MTSYWTLTIIVLTCVVHFVNGATFLVTAPKKIYYDSEFTVSVSAHGVETYDSVTLSYRGSASKKVLHKTTLRFKTDEVQTWGAVFRSSEMAKNKDPAVILEVLGRGESKRLYLTFNDMTGYIFIQTDKPLYTPGQKVKFRVIALDEYQRFALTYPVKVDIMNPNSIVIDRMSYLPPEAFTAQEIDLPREATLGNWTITATYENLGGRSSKVYSTIFEVREYVLPRFTTVIDVTPKVITDKTELVTVRVKAKYVFGQFVRGLAEIEVGIQDPSLLHPFMVDEVYMEELTGKGVEFTFNITKLIPEGLIDERQKHLLVNVIVTEKGTMETDKVQDDSTLIVKPFYSVSFEGSRKKFKPAFKYSLQARVTDATGNMASGLKMDLAVTFQNTKGMVIDGHSKTLSVDQNGKILEQFPTPPQSMNMTVRLSLKSGTQGKLFGNELHVLKLQSTDRQYLQISVDRPLTNYKDGSLRLQYTRSRYRRPITVLVLSRGHLVYTTYVNQERDGDSYVQIPSLLYSETLPFMRVVAYYHYESIFKSVFISDSLRLPTQSVCKENLYLHKDFMMMGSQKPKSHMDLFAQGGPSMRIGLVAVDKAVFALTADYGLTREAMFHQLASHDLGKDNADIYNHETNLKSSGLVRVIFVSESFSMADPRKRSSLNHFYPSKAHYGLFGPRGIQKELVRPKPAFFREILVESEKDEETEVVSSPVTETGKKTKPVRRYFPESWLFEEHYLSSTGRLRLNVTLPDSLTTWSIMAVGVSPSGAMCVSKPIEQRVQKLFYADIRLPYKVTRLEEVRVKVVLVNHHTYNVKAKVVIEGSASLCFSSKKVMTNTGKNSTHFTMKLAPKSSKIHVVKVIPLHSGKPTITVHAKSHNDVDTVEKKLYVVAEGQKMRHTLTFVLDPEAKHATFRKSRSNITTLMNTTTLTSTIFDQRKQHTKINLAMPKEFIKGTESCKISAFGDIMGDVINSAVVKSNSLVDFSLKDAEEVIGDLGPTVHVLLYANRTGLITDELRIKGQQFIGRSILRLLNYRDGPAFRLTKKSPKATWLTAVALKTLCHAAPLAYIDKESLIDQGFEWLVEQIDEDGSLMEEDWRLAKDSFDYKIMLSAEALIAATECDELFTERLLNQQLNLTANYVEQHIENISDVMVMAKVAYALTRFDAEGEMTQAAVNRLSSMMQTNNFGHVYWANETVTNENRKVPFWYRKGAKASSIEATAFALLVYLHNGSIHIDAIADWLVTQRNHQGVFVGALDSMAAVQALSVYSAEKHGIKVDLSCKLWTSRIKEFSHSFKFTENNSIHPKSLSNVPVGDVMEVITKGQGLGQMHVNVEFNVPIDKNAKCRYNVSVQVKYVEVKYGLDMTDYPLCMYCDVDCPKPEVKVADVFNDTLENDFGNATSLNMTFNGTKMTVMDDGPSSLPLYLNDMPIPLPLLNVTKILKLTKAEKILKMERGSTTRSRGKTSRQNSYSRESLCIQVCVEYLDDSEADDTVIEIEMLTGYTPIPSDIERLEEKAGVKYSYYDRETETIIVRYYQLPEGKVCFTFRVLKEEDILKPTAAIVYVKEYGNCVPSCVKEYSAPVGHSLHVFCANSSNINMGECQCFSGLCSVCMPDFKRKFSLHDAHQMVCKADIGYQIHIRNMSNNGAWTDYEAEVLTVNKTGTSHKPRKSIILSSPLACSCPHKYALRKKPLYMLSRNVEKMVNQGGENIYRYVLDENSKFLNVAPPKGSKNEYEYAQLPHYPMHLAFSRNKQCKK